MAVVHFSVVGEYLGDLGRDQDMIERQIVRCTHLWQHAGDGQMALAVNSSCIIGGHVVMLDVSCGVFLPDSPGEQKAQDKAAATREQIAKFCTERGLEMRPGRFLAT